MSLISRASAVSLLVLAAACGGLTTTSEDGFVSLCQEGEGLLLARGFDPATPVDFVGNRSESTQPRVVGSGPTADPAPPPAEDAGTGTGRDAGTGGLQDQEAAWTATLGEDRRGTPCASASEPTRCNEDLAALRLLGDTCDGLAIVPKDVAAGFGAPAEAPSPRMPGSCSTAYYVFTRGNEIGTFRNRAEALAFFGVVNTPEEAVQLLVLGGESVTCGSSYRIAADGFDIRTGGTRSRVVHVASDGTTKVL